MAVSKMERHRQLALNIAYYRKYREYTQEKLAEILGISRGHLARIESTTDESSLSIDLLFEIADALDIEPAMLFEIR